MTWSVIGKQTAQAKKAYWSSRPGTAQFHQGGYINPAAWVLAGLLQKCVHSKNKGSFRIQMNRYDKMKRYDKQINDESLATTKVKEIGTLKGS